MAEPAKNPSGGGRTRQPQASDKLAFLLVLVPYLMEHGRVTVDEVANHFGVPPARVRDAVRLIGISGIPGETGTYQHGDLFDIAWDDFEQHDEIVLTNLVAIDEAPRFSAREAAALIAGLQYLSGLPENADRAAISTLMAKLALGASASPSPVAVEDSASNELVAVIRDAVDRGRRLEFEYLDWEGRRARRRVDPLRIESLDSDWYLRAWDHDREAPRTFRLDRVSTPTVTDEGTSERAREAVLGDSLFEGSSDDIVVTLDVARAAMPLIADFAPTPPVEAADPERVTTSIRVANLHRLKRLVASLSGAVTVVAPDEARRIVVDWARRALDNYPNTPD